MRVHSLCRGPLLGFLVYLLIATSFCYGNEKTVQVVGVGECADCKENNIKTSDAFTGLRVTIDCKIENGEMQRVGVGELDKQGKFKVSLPQEFVKDGKLKDECYAQLHSASAAPCPAHNGLDDSKIVLKSNNNGKHTFGTNGNLKFSTALCTSAFLWPFYKFPHLPKVHPWKKHLPKVSFPPLKNFGHPWPLPPFPPIYKKPLPPIPIYKKPLPPPVPIYKPEPPVKPLPPPVPIYKPEPPVVKPLPPPVPVYKPKPNPKPPVEKPPEKKPCPPQVPKPKPKPKPTPKPKPPVEKPPEKKPCPPTVPKPEPPFHKPPVVKPLPPPVPIYKPPPIVKPLPPPVPIYKPPPIIKPLPPPVPIYKPLPPPVPIYKPLPSFPKKPCPPFPELPPFHHPKYGVFPPFPPSIPPHP